MRAPFQVLVIPFRRNGLVVEYCSLRRSDTSCWQAVAGGGEEGDTPAVAALREASEELGILNVERLIRLDTCCSIPKYHFADSKFWDASLFVIPEYCFALDCSSQSISLSSEHSDFKWADFETTLEAYYFDSNKTALWELDSRLHMNCFDEIQLSI